MNANTNVLNIIKSNNSDIISEENKIEIPKETVISSEEVSKEEIIDLPKEEVKTESDISILKTVGIAYDWRVLGTMSYAGYKHIKSKEDKTSDSEEDY